MRKTIASLLLSAAATALAAQTGEPDPLNSSECAAAREELQQTLDAPAANRQDRLDRLAQARQRAALRCLGSDSGRRERSGAPATPQLVPPATATQRPTSPTLPPVAPPPPPPLAPPRPAPITTCDLGGCWDSEGQRLNRMGPLLIGPRGTCTLQGGLLICP